MSESLFSSSWYRVATVKPRLRSHAQIHRHVYRGEVWYVLQDHSTGRFHRFTPIANRIIGLMDGKRSVQEIWDLACVRLGDEVPSQDDVIKLLSDLHKADVLQSDAPPDIHELQQRRQKHARMRWKQYVGNPLSLRFPLLDPDKLLNRMMPYTAFMFGWFGAALWLGMVGWALTLAAMHWPELSSDVADRVFSVENMLLMWLVFPIIKGLHELGHGLAAKAGGGEVHEMGIMLLVLMPIPYVDASSASAFRDKRQRMLVGAAGMAVELFIAAIAMLLWVQLEPGIERAIAYNVMLVAGVSALLFNGNPLLRYDAYYILADYLEIPNLAQRSNEYIGYLVNRYLFGVEGVTSPVSARGERGWFLFFAPASFAYRMVIMVSIVLLVASEFFVIGVILGLWAVVTMLLLPIGKKMNYLVSSPRLHKRRQRALLASGLVLGVLAVLLFWLPAPSSTRTEGVVWAPEQSLVRAAVDGFVTKVVAAPNQPVRRGDVLIQCEDPELKARLRVLRAQRAELESRYAAFVISDRVQANIVRGQIAHIDNAIHLARQKLAELQVVSPANGTFVMRDPQDAPGRFVQRGEVLAYVTDNAAVTVRVVVPQADADMVRKRTRSVDVRPVERIADVIPARVLREVPGATNELPSMALSLQGGGKIGLDPDSAGETQDKAKTLETLFVLDIGLPPGTQVNSIGSRIYVRFEHQPEPLGYQWYRGIRRVFLKSFNV